MRSKTKLLLLLSLVTAVSCGGKDSSKKNPEAAANQPEVAAPAPAPEGEPMPTSGVNYVETAKPDGSNVNGIYAAELYAVNTNLHLGVIGAAAVTRDGDNFTAQVKLNYGAKDAPYKQAIYTGSRCPLLSDDLNKDNYIDIQEALIGMGKIVVPLDSNLDSQAEGFGDYPVGDAVAGKFSYKVSASFDRLFADLKAEDTNTTDLVTKLSEGISFQGKAVMIQGTNEMTWLPPSVASTPGESPFRTLPVACGYLWKADALPAGLN